MVPSVQGVVSAVAVIIASAPRDRKWRNREEPALIAGPAMGKYGHEHISPNAPRPFQGKATVGARTLANTQPFAREVGGRMHVFAHNGHLPNIASDPRFVLRSFRPIGETDSERAFCALLSRLEPVWRQSATAPQALDRYAILARFARDLRSLGPANFLYSDGELLVAHAHRRVQENGKIAPPGLWTLERECAEMGAYAATSGLTIESRAQRVVLVASVPLSNEAWRPCSEGELVVLKDAEVVPTGAR